MTENFKQNIGTLDSVEVPSYYSKYNIRQKLVFAKFISTRPKGQFEFSWKIFRILFGLWATNFQEGCQNSILRVQRNILGLKNFKREHVHSELANHGEKSVHPEGVYYDGK